MVKKSCLNKYKFSSGLSYFKNGKEKKFLSISVLYFTIVNFMPKKKCSL